MNDKEVGSIQFAVNIEIAIKALTLEIRNARIKKIHAGDCKATGRFLCEGVLRATGIEASRSSRHYRPRGRTENLAEPEPGIRPLAINATTVVAGGQWGQSLLSTLPSKF